MTSSAIGEPLPYGPKTAELVIAEHVEGINRIRVSIRGDAMIFHVAMDDNEGEIGIDLTTILEAIQDYGHQHES